MPDRDSYFLRQIWDSPAARQLEIVDIEAEIDDNSHWIYPQDGGEDSAAIEARPVSSRLYSQAPSGRETLVGVRAKTAAGRAWTTFFLANHGHTVLSGTTRQDEMLEVVPEADDALTRVLKEVALLSGESGASAKQKLDVTYCFRRLQGFMSDQQAEIWLDSDNERIGTRPLHALVAERVADVILAMDAQETFVY
jgi:hypothetical protein